MKKKTIPNNMTAEDILDLAEQIKKASGAAAMKENVKTPAEKMGGILKAIRKQHKKTQLDVAQELGYKSLNFISEIERGKAKPPKDRLMHFISAFGGNFRLKPLVLKAYYPDIWRHHVDLLIDLEKEDKVNFDPAGYGNELAGKIDREEVDDAWLAK